MNRIELSLLLFFFTIIAEEREKTASKRRKIQPARGKLGSVIVTTFLMCPVG